MLTPEQESLIDHFKLDRNSEINGWIIALYENDIPLSEIVTFVQSADYYSQDILKVIIDHLQYKLNIEDGN